MLSFEKVMEESEMGFARHKVIYDETEKPVNFCFLSVNPAFERMTGLKKSKILNRRITKVIPKIVDDDFDWIDFFGKIATEGERRVFEQYFTPLDRWYRVEAFSYEKGYFTTVFSDITHERELVEASKAFLDDRQGSNSYDQITQRMKKITGARYVALNVFLEGKGKFRTTTIAGLSSTLQKVTEMLGFNLYEKEWVPAPACTELIRVKAVATFDHLHELTDHFISKSSTRLVEKTLNLGKVNVIKITQDERIIGDFTLIFSKDNQLVNETEALVFAEMVGMLIEKRNRQFEHEMSKDRFQRAIEGTGAGLWDWDMVKNRVFFSKRWKSMLGYEDHEVVNDFSGWKNLWHPEDAPRIEKALNEYLEGKTDHYEIEHRLRHKDGSWHWINTRGDFERDLAGKPIRWTGTNIDITARKHMEYELSEQTVLLRMIFDAFPGFIGLKDLSGRFVMVNKTLAVQWGLDPEKMIGKTDVDLLGDIPEARQYMKDDREVLLSDCQKIVPAEPVPTRDGQTRWFTTLKMPFMVPGSEEKSLLFIAVDISQQKELELLLQRQKSELKASNEEMEAMNEELIESMEEARKADKAKTEFLATMSHELRTPLNGVLGFSRILKGTPLNENQQEFVDIVIHSANNLLGLISDILDFSRIETNRLDLILEKTDIKKLVKHTLEVVQSKAMEKGIELVNDVQETFPGLVSIDSLRFNQVLLNLLTNAIKFTDEGSVTVTVKKNGIDQEKKMVDLHFSVRDTGIGIGEEHQKIIFDLFSQADMSNTRKFGGTGLGLAIATQLLNKMGSDLQLTSTPGKGSDFYFDIVLPYYEEASSEENGKTTPVAVDTETKISDLAGKKILLVEDDPINMKLAKAALSSFSGEIELLEAKNGKEAYHLFLEHQPDMVLMDIIMPELDGYQATAMIRDHDQQIPIVAMTAKALKKDKVDCLAAGMNDYISKPISLNQLKETLTRYLL